MPHILIIKTSSLGDVVHNLPVVADIRARWPNAVIDWVVEEGFAEIPALHPQVRRVIPVATRRWRRTLFRPATWREMREFRREVRSQHYDLVLDTQGLLKSAVIAWMARGPSYGQDKYCAREPLAARLYDHVFAVATGRHAVERNRDLAAQAMKYPLPATPPDYGIRPPAEPSPLSLSGNYAVCLHGSSRDSKLWPERHWIDFAAGLVAAGITPILPWGSAREEQRARSIAAAVKQAHVPPKLSLRQLAVLMGQARAVVGVDTGLVHLAAALNCPAVAIYLDSSPLLTGVLPSDPARAVNLGGAGELPSPDDVRHALARLGVTA